MYMFYNLFFFFLVCSVVAKENFLFSGSWDKTARVWQDSSSVLTLSGHTAAIWAVEILESADCVSNLVVLTGSADKTIKMWKGNSPFQVFKGHTDCVRALAVCSSDQFLSAANDATIRLWITSGECLSTFYGHTNYIYGLVNIEKILERLLIETFLFQFVTNARQD